MNHFTKKNRMRRSRIPLILIVMIVVISSVPVFSADGLDSIAADCEKALSEAGIGITWLNHNYRYTGIGNMPEVEDGLYQVLLLDEISPYRYAEDGSAIFGQDGNLVVPVEYDAIREFTEGLAPVLKIYNRGSENQYGRFGFIDRTGKLVIPIEYEQVGIFSEGLIPVQRPGDENYYESWGYLDKNGNLAIPFSFAHVGNFHGGAASATVYSDLPRSSGPPVSVGLIDKSGAWILEPVYDGVGYAGEGLFSVSKEEGPYRLYDPSGKIVFTHSSEEPFYFTGGISAIRKNNKYGIVDIQGNQLLPCEYDQLGFDENNAFIRVAKGDFATKFDWGVVDRTGKEIIPLQYKSIEISKNGLIALQDHQDNWGIIDGNGRIVFALEYTSIGILENGALWASSKSDPYRIKLFDPTGTPLFPQEFCGVEGFSEGIWIVGDESGLYGGLDENGNTVIPFVFSRLTPVKNGRALAGLRGPLAYEEDISFADRAAIITLPGPSNNAANPAGNSSENTGVKKIRALYNGTEIPFDQDPFIENSRTLVPMRAIFEAAQAEVEWHGDAMLVTGKKRNPDGSVRTVQLTIGESTAFVDGEAITLDVPARLSGGRTMVPLRFVTENLSGTAKVEWDQEQLLITITDEASDQ